jgi:hypothetical protein
MNTINQTYINALLADASYVKIMNEQGDAIIPTEKQLEALKKSLTEPQAKYVIDNFEVLNQELSPVGGFDAVVWRGKTGTEFAGKVYVSMRGTQGIFNDGVDDIELFGEGVPSDQIVSMVNCCYY